MIITSRDFDLYKIAESGQCFRMVRDEKGTYEVIHKKNYLRIKPVSYDEATGFFSVDLDCGEKEYETIWKSYFDMETDYAGMASMVDKDDAFLKEAVNYGRGIRILNQDPWEMLISFIISQRKSIPAIRTSIERLCGLCGDRIETGCGIRYAFPDAGVIAALSDSELKSCGTGYRAPYISEAAAMVAGGELDVYGINEQDDEKLKNTLMSVKGVGAKVANCVMLFGYRRLDSFPEDVWIKRAMEEKYPDGFPFERYMGYGGIMQQYIFFYMRGRGRT